MVWPGDLLNLVPRLGDELVDVVVRAQMGGEVLIDDATYRAAYGKIYAAYEQARRERVTAELAIHTMNPVGVSAGMPGVMQAAKKSQALMQSRVVADLVDVESQLAEILGSMYTAFSKGLAADAAGAAEFRSAGA